MKYLYKIIGTIVMFIPVIMVTLLVQKYYDWASIAEIWLIVGGSIIIPMIGYNIWSQG